MLLLEPEELEEVHLSYGGHEVLIGIDAVHSHPDQAVSQAGKMFPRNFRDLLLEIQVATLFPGIKRFVSVLGFPSLSLYPHCAIQMCRCLDHCRCPPLRSRLAWNDLHHVFFALRHDVPAVHQDWVILVSCHFSRRYHINHGALYVITMATTRNRIISPRNTATPWQDKWACDNFKTESWGNSLLRPYTNISVSVSVL